MKRPVIRDIVSVPEHPTVVRLDAIGAPGSEWIAQSYCLTPDVKGHLTALTSAFAESRGKGIFVIGPYGSGKTHLLAWIITRLQTGALVPNGPGVAFVSLVNFSATMRLEDIILESLKLENRAGDRRVTWSAVAERFPGGLVLVLDELSEFLRSKADPRSFNEDVRFLQFLGEWAAGNRFWTIGALQEGIERTGDIEHELYRKIKDRYPLRLMLSPAHIRDLIADGVLSKAIGYKAAVAEVVKNLEQATPPGIRLDAELLLAIYPLHPATLALLEEVRDRFSQARGVIDFTVTQLRGDVQRGVAPFLDQPLGALLTPDIIIDHYRDLLAIQPEFLPLSDKVFPFFQKNMDRIVDKESLRTLSWRLIKLLSLVSLSRSRKGLTAAEATYWLGFAAIQVAPEKNVQIVAAALDRLATDGEFVKSRQGQYYLDTDEDAGGAFTRLLARELSQMVGGEGALFDELCALLPEGQVNPLSLPRGAWQPRDVKWYCHDRRGFVYIDNDEPPAPPAGEGVALVIRLPWGEPGPSTHHPAIIPSALPMTDAVREAIACARILDKPVAAEVAKRAEKMLADRVAVIGHDVSHAYHRARRIGPSARTEVAPVIERFDATEPWLQANLRWVLQITYPAFERVAPKSGPLSHEAYRAFFRFIEMHDILSASAEPALDLIREGYLVPMKLLKPAGREYHLPPNLDKHELVKLAEPLIENGATPESLYSYLAGPVYGLVPDQIHSLLIFLYTQGEIDIRRGQRSIGEMYETFPTPQKYDRIEKGGALDPRHAKSLEQMCVALGVKPPSQNTVLSHRQAADRAAAQVRTRTDPLWLLALNLAQADGTEELVKRIERFVGWSRAFTGNADALSGFNQLLFEAGSAARYVEELEALRGLPERIERLITERDRYAHLMAGIPRGVLADPDAAVLLTSLSPPPALDAIEALDRWIGSAARAYTAYTKAYIAAHQERQAQVAAHPAWRFEIPRMAALRHVGLTQLISRYQQLKSEAAEQRCERLSNLSFQPVCACGFDGARAPVEESLDRLAAVQKELMDELHAFFAKAEVKRSVQSFADARQERGPAVMRYLDGALPVPDIADINALEKHLAGLSTVVSMSLGQLGDTLTSRTWTKRALFETLDRLIVAEESEPIRFEEAPARGVPESVVTWCVTQTLKTGVPLPAGLAEVLVTEAVQRISLKSISPAALARIDALGLPEEQVDRLLGLLIAGTLDTRLPANRGPLTACALDMIARAMPQTMAEYAEKIDTCYRMTERMRQVAPAPWSAWLQHLSEWKGLHALPDALALLGSHEKAQWVIVDALGIPLLQTVTPLLEDWMPSWRLEGIAFGRLDAKATTNGFYDALTKADVRHPFDRIGCLDKLIHERRAPFGELVKLAVAELGIAMRQHLPRLDRARAVIVSADHGCRISEDGCCLTHGGPTALEVTIPIFHLIPR